MTRLLLFQTLLSSAAAYDVFVDSVSGDDGNTGASPTQAFQTFSALTITDGLRIGIANGSTFAETLTITEDNVTVGAYGSGASPILDCSDVFDSESWQDSTARADANTNVYTQTVTTEGTTSCFHNVYADGAFLVRVANIATCQSTEGSYYISADTTTTPTIGIHPTGDTDPGSDGVEYRFTARQYAIVASGQSGITVRGLTTRRNLHESGSTVVGDDCLLHNCVFEDGNKHLVYAGENATVVGCTFTDLYYAGDPATMLIFNKNILTGGSVTVRDCTFTFTTYDNTSNALYGHYNTSGSFGAWLVDSCTFTNMAECIDAVLIPTSMTVLNPTCTNCKRLLDATRALTYTVTNPAFVINNASLTAGVFVQVGASAVLQLTGGSFTSNAAGTGVNLAGNSGSVTLTNVTISMTNTNTSNGCITTAASLSGLAVTTSGCTFATDSTGYAYLWNSVPTYVGDTNCFDNNGGFRGYRAPTIYTAIATWRTATSQDTASTVGGC